MQNVMKKTFVYAVTVILAFVMSFSFSMMDANAAAYPSKIKLKTQVASKTVDIGGVLKVSVKSVTPKNASKSVSWKKIKGGSHASLKAKKAASVKVKGKSRGAVVVKAKAKYGDASKTIKIKVRNLKAKKLTLSTGKQNISLGKTFTLKAKVTAPAKYGYKKQVTKWTSSNAKVATVSATGVVTAKALGSARITAVNDGASAVCAVTVPETSILRAYTLVGTYSPEKIDYTAVDKDAKVYIWDKAANKEVAGTNTKKVIYGNFAQMEDTDADNDADIVRVVNRADSTYKWDNSMVWKDGIGENVEPSLSDADAENEYDKEYRVPFGERQLSGFGITDYCGTNDFQDQANSPYWPTHDYYNLKSGNGLTMLEGYKTRSQSTGWSCVTTSADTVLDWYNERGDLNDQDLAALRGSDRSKFEGGTSLKELENIFNNLTDMGITGKWNITDSYTSGAEDNLYDSDWIQEQLKEGHPIIVIWNAFDAHGQVIIGYDNMGTTTGSDPTADDQLIMMDPYDTTDHCNDGYTIQSYERLAYGTLSWDGTNKGTQFFVASPAAGWSYTPSTTGGLSKVNSNTFKSSDSNKLISKLYGKTKEQLDYYYDNVERGDEYDLGGAAGYERDFQVDNSPYYNFIDFYNYENGTTTSTLKMVENFKTLQQATEWTCGCASASMVIEHFGKNGTTSPFETEISLCKKRQNGERGATYLSGMKEIFNYMNSEHGQDWVYLTRNDLNDPEEEWSTITGKSGTEYALQGGSSDSGLIPYMIDKGIPVMIGWDEWGGHWQAIIGYDDMGTSNTQDDVIVLADPYDTTDHECDGYVVESFERLVYGWDSSFEADGGQGTQYNDFIVAFPKTYNDNTKAAAAEFGLDK